MNLSSTSMPSLTSGHFLEPQASPHLHTFTFRSRRACGVLPRGRTSMLVAAAALLLVATDGLARAQGISAEGQARAVTLMAAIAGFCPVVIPTDHDLAVRMADAERIVGIKLAGAKWKKLMQSEGARRLAEVKITGAKYWCENQRLRLRQIGASEVFP